MEYVIIGFVILLIWGNISRRKNPVHGVKTTGSAPIAGDNFNSGFAIVSGVCEPPKSGTLPPIPIHVFIPVDPPPIAIQKKTTIYPEGSLIKGSGDEVDLVQNGKRRWIPDPYTFTAMGFNWNNVQTIPDTDFNAIPKGQRLPRILPPVALPKVNPTNPVLVTPTPTPIHCNVAPIRSAGCLLWGTGGNSAAGTNRRVASPNLLTCGNGPGWCTSKLDQLASMHCWAAQSTGCAGF